MNYKKLVLVISILGALTIFLVSPYFIRIGYLPTLNIVSYDGKTDTNFIKTYNRQGRLIYLARYTGENRAKLIFEIDFVTGFTLTDKRRMK